eukprot:TRINITY_DN371_c0_g1_i2.p1 TRINITY_DN371_c0_g1~~TRINITY_DN371_c0_g1_i2.p1  ORF type:complete len:146 (-),score=39.48 TRINITY_DN371_c0_g1_i2:72-509(-)
MLRNLLQRTTTMCVVPRSSVHVRSFASATRQAAHKNLSTRERKPLETNIHGFDTPDLLTGAFGTMEVPVVVPTVNDSRIVGCLGGDGDKGHQMIFHWATIEKPTVCLECGQVFKLHKVEDHHEDQHDHPVEGGAPVHGHSTTKQI